MSTVTSTSYLGWRAPFLTVADLVRTRGASERRWWDWHAAADTVNRLVMLKDWAARLAPGSKDVELGARPVYRAASAIDRRHTVVRRYEKSSLEEYGHTVLDLPVQIPMEWLRLPGPVYRLRAASAILDALIHVGVAAGLGPPVLRAKATKGSTVTELDQAQTINLGRWLDAEIESTPPGHAVLVAVRTGNDRRQAMRQRFLAKLGTVDELAVPELPDRFAVWRAPLLPPSALDERE